jgi:phosphoesterase RecJ-like protein
MEKLISDIVKTIQTIQKSHSLLITSSASPDGDSIASQLILRDFVRQIKKDTPYNLDILNESPCPRVFSFLEGSERIMPWDKARPLDHYDAGIVTDGGPDRTGPVYPLFKACQKRIIVDHHLVGSHDSCQIQVISPEVSSTCELLYRFLEIPDSPLRLNKALAEMVYVGIVCDTGAFQYNLTHASTHRIAAELLSMGINFSSICERVLLERPVTARRLQGEVLEHFQSTLQGRIAWGKVTRKLVRELQVQPGDNEGLVNFINFTEGVEVAVLFSEVETRLWKISLRARGRCNVAQVARTLTPDGGGHERAAGCTLAGTYREVKNKAIGLIKEFLKASEKK